MKIAYVKPAIFVAERTASVVGPAIVAALPVATAVNTVNIASAAATAVNTVTKTVEAYS